MLPRIASRRALVSLGLASLLVAPMAVLSGGAAAQELKPVPRDSIRVAIPGCTRGVLLVAGTPAEDRPAGSAVPEGTRLRMNGPKKLMAEIKGHEGSRIEITGLIKRGQVRGDGVPIGGGVRVGGGFGGPAAGTGRGLPAPAGDQVMIDVEGWRSLPGDCPR